ncbi:MAG: RNA-binding S4 domain-containing protein [Eubacteriales bacterium]|nr:RNA-binding S4 domain-containing protein [Eubacteriales bacterium]
MRIDKFLKKSRIIKRRTLSKQACEQGRILINNKPAKPGTTVEVGDIIEITFGGGIVKIEVILLLDSQKKEDAEKMYRILENKI